MLILRLAVAEVALIIFGSEEGLTDHRSYRLVSAAAEVPDAPRNQRRIPFRSIILLALVEISQERAAANNRHITTSILLASIPPAVALSVSFHRFVASGTIVLEFHSFANPFTGGDESLPIDVSAGDHR